MGGFTNVTITKKKINMIRNLPKWPIYWRIDQPFTILNFNTFNFRSDIGRCPTYLNMRVNIYIVIMIIIIILLLLFNTLLSFFTNYKRESTEGFCS